MKKREMDLFSRFLPTTLPLGPVAWRRQLRLDVLIVALVTSYEANSFE
jgi:hypothetical protein